MFTLPSLSGSISGSRNGVCLTSDLQHTYPYCFFLLEISKPILDLQLAWCFVSIMCVKCVITHSCICKLNIVATSLKLNDIWLSIPWEMSTYESVEDISCKDTEVRKKGSSSSVLVAAAVAMDTSTVLSVAASIVISLLLMSGDVEENPGPGGTIIMAVYR